MTNWLPVLGRTILSLSILGAGVAGLLWMGLPEVPTQIPIPDPPPLVSTELAIDHTDGIAFDVDGVVVPYREIRIAAQVGGKVKSKSESCRSGMTVRKGDLLLRIEPDDYELEVSRLTEELAQADAMIRELEAETLSSENQIKSLREQNEIELRLFKRIQDMARRSAASDSEVDSARKSELATRNAMQSMIDQKNLLTQRQARMVSAKALVQANLDKADLNLTRTEIYSPIDGVVVSESVEQGGYVQAGGALMVLQDTSRLDVTCKLHMRQMHWLWQSDAADRSPDEFAGGYNFPETPATVIYDLGDEDYAWKAVVDRYDGAGIDTQTRMVPCRVHVDDPTSVVRLSELNSSRKSKAFVTTQPATLDQANSAGVPSGGGTSLGAQIANARTNLHPPTLMTGMFVKVRIHAKPPIPLVRLPQEAIQPGNTVWIVRDGMLHKKAISIATSTPRYVVAYQLSEGLHAGDLVVTSPLASPTEGMQVSTAGNEPASKPAGGKSWRGGGGDRPSDGTPGQAGDSRS